MNTVLAILIRSACWTGCKSVLAINWVRESRAAQWLSSRALWAVYRVTGRSP